MINKNPVPADNQYRKVSMMIDRIGQFNPVQMGGNGMKNQLRDIGSGDSIDVSAMATERALVYQATELAKSAEVVSDARIAELRTKINDPSYLSGTIEGTADNIMDAFGL